MIEMVANSPLVVLQNPAGETSSHPLLEKEKLMRRLLVFSSVVLLFCLPVAMNAQSASSATITGQVVDPQGAELDGSKFTATNVYTAISRTPNTTVPGAHPIPN